MQREQDVKDLRNKENCQSAGPLRYHRLAIQYLSSTRSKDCAGRPCRTCPGCHHSDIERGLNEARRVAKQQVVLLTWVGFAQDFWLLDYLPQIREIDEPLFPSIDELAQILGPLRVIPVPIPHDCTDGFLCAYWRRPHAYLDEGVRTAISTFSRIGDFEEGLHRLEKDLRSGAWEDRYDHLFHSESMDYGYRVVVTQSEVA